ncbi:MAG: DUF262 domain-containing protein [Chthoniobacterales bacterium]
MADFDSKEIFSLRDIATWQIPSLAPLGRTPSWVAELPSLQRGAVWKPYQIELLWDSIFRGFPIGSLVISEHLSKQRSRVGQYATSTDPWPDAPKRHLLDGQQRCNAISLGYLRCFDEEATDSTEKGGSILWLDILGEDIPPGSTREYLFRMTTSAHPWGYIPDDKASRLPAYEIRQCLQNCGWALPSDPSYQRPSPKDLQPYKSKIPIPIAWLMLEAREGEFGNRLWDKIADRCQSVSTHWAKEVFRALRPKSGRRNADVESSLAIIEAGLARALKMRLVALEIPKDTILAESRMERSSIGVGGVPSEQNISNIEHLFQRLNNGGTLISADELQYSMIKARWPGIEAIISRIKISPVRPSRLVLLGARAALSVNRTNLPRLHPELSIVQLRRLANDPRDRPLIEAYFGLFENADVERKGHGDAEEKPPFVKVVDRVDEWLLDTGESPGAGQAAERKIGLPPVLRSSIANDSPEVYLLLLLLAQRSLREVENPSDLRVPILGLVTALHWFSWDKRKAVESAYEKLQSAPSLTREAFFGIFRKQNGEGIGKWLLPLPSPHELFEIIPPLKEHDLAQWRWGEQSALKEVDSDGIERRREKELLRETVRRIRENKEMLIYAQREWMAQSFNDFDPANITLWGDNNCPWDYDHVLPWTNISNIKRADEIYMAVCKEWGRTIANLHILSFEENRSKGAKPASASLAGRERLMLFGSETELSAFDLNRDDVAQNAEKVLRFVQTARARLLRIYEDWFAALASPSLLE